MEVGGCGGVAAQRDGRAGALGRQLGWAGVSISFGMAEGERSPEVVRYLCRIRVGGGTVSLSGKAGRGGANGVVVGWCAPGMARGRGKLG